MVVACWDGSVYILLSVSLPNKELNVTHFWLPGGELQRGAQGHSTQQYRCQAPGLVFRPTIGTLLPQKDPAQ